MPCSLNRFPLRAFYWLLAASAIGLSSCSNQPESNDQPAAPGEASTAPAEAPATLAAVVDDGTSWPVFRGDMRGSGVASTTLPQRPELLWKQRLGDAIEATAAIVDGAIYVGCFDGYLYSLNLTDGSTRWKFPPENPPEDGKTTAADGAAATEQPPSSLDSATLGFRAPAAVHDGRVYIGDIDGMFYCVNAADGKLLWSLETGAEINAGATFFEGNVLVASQDGSLYCLNAESGEERWTYTTGDMIQCSPSIADGHAFVAGCDSLLHVVNLSTGKADGDKVQLESQTCSTPAIAGDFVFFGTEGGVVLGVNWREKKVGWQYESQRGSSFRSSPAVSEGLVVIGARDRQVHGIDAKTGDEAWTFSTGGEVDSSPVIVGNRVFIGSGDSRLYGLDLASGDELWQFEAGGQVVAAPAVASGLLVVGNVEGDIFCFGAK